MRRSSASSLIQRVYIRNFCSSSLHPEAAAAIEETSPNLRSSYLKWGSAVLAGSSLGGGALYWNYTSNADSDLSPTFQKMPKFLFGDAFRRRVFFNYEKRIRLRSPPEKIFEYFASIKTSDGEVLMTPADLMRAVVPVFPPSESKLVREGYLRGERSPGELRCAPSQLFMLFDMDNDGLISFEEYIFFVPLLSIPESSFTVAFKMFDLDHNGEIDIEEFKKVMALMRAHNRQGAFHRDRLQTALKVSSDVEHGGLVEKFFGTDGTKLLHHDKFVQFMRDLQDEVCSLLSQIGRHV